MNLLLAIFVFAMLSCGIKGKPLPPLPEEPLPAVESEKPLGPVQPLDSKSASGTTKSKTKKKK